MSWYPPESFNIIEARIIVQKSIVWYTLEYMFITRYLVGINNQHSAFSTTLRGSSANLIREMRMELTLRRLQQTS